jgi:heme-degrading monooxygenase HmoA
VAAWRNVEHHRSAQKTGRNAVLRDYRLRVAHVLRDYGMDARAEAPADSRRSNG